MKERPILFNGEMVRALLAGRKTQTRRVVKPQPILVDDRTWTWPCDGKDAKLQWWKEIDPNTEDAVSRFSPYGVPGDRLWVKEAFRGEAGSFTDESQPYPFIYYKADVNPERESCLIKWKPSIHMPRSASRILLEVVSVRVERVQDISEYDCREEGINLEACQECGYTSKDASIQMDHYLCKGQGFPEDREVYKKLWDSINESRGLGWDVNSWVWVVEFKVLEPAQT